MCTNKTQLINSIYDIIKDYRGGNVITTNRIERWVNQFDTEVQEIILREMYHIFQNLYFSKDHIKNCLKDFIKNVIKTPVQSVNFLQIQDDGESQADLLDLIDEILFEEYELQIKQCGGSKTFVYIDDGIYSGNKFRYDIVPWIKASTTPSNCNLITVHIGVHISGYKYAIKHIKTAAKDKNINVESKTCLQLDNYRNFRSKVEFVWPREVTGVSDINKYVKRITNRCEENGWRTDRFFRTRTVSDKYNIFLSNEGRNVVEKEFLKIGAKLVMAAQNPSNSMRPLGFDRLESLGFGALFIPYRNISNNCPLALWYGDPDNYNASHPFGLWYPLFPRKQKDDYQDDFKDIFNW